jgi:SAM-dependent methyltransferase
VEPAAWVRSQLPPPPSRVLEVGCGEGALARALADAGYDVTAIDPAAPEGAIFRRLKLEDLEEDQRFAAVVAVRSLHHVTDLEFALDKIITVLEPRGRLILEEFAWDRLDLETAQWFHEQRGAAQSLEDCCRDWETEHVGLHGYASMRPELDRRFEERHFEWMPYLHRLLNGSVDEAVERALIERGEISATGFRYLGVVVPG